MGRRYLSNVGRRRSGRTGTGRRILAIAIALVSVATIALVGPSASAALPSGTASVATAGARIDGFADGSGTPVYAYVANFVAAAGDMNGDGHDDVALDAYDSQPAGIEGFLFFGPLSGSMYPSQADVRLTADGGIGKIESAGDIDGDGHDDLIVITSPNQPSAEAVVVYGPLTGGTTLDLDTVTSEIHGPATGDGVTEAHGAGDVNDDGKDDLLVGSYGPSGSAVYVVLGGSVGPSGLSLADAEAKITGVDPGGALGSSFDAAGDLNGDGVADIILSFSFDGTAGAHAGAAYIFLGPISGTHNAANDADATIIGAHPGDLLGGGGVAGVGDVTGDGLDDVLVTVPRNDNGADGDIYLFSGLPTSGSFFYLTDAAAKLHAAETYVVEATMSGNVGDLNGDGQADLLIGLGGQDVVAVNDGATYVNFGPVTGSKELSASDVTLYGEASGDFAGSSASGVGDTNGDGVNDVMIGAQDHNVLVPASGPGAPVTAGAAYLFLGTHPDTTPPTVTGVPDRSPNGNGWYDASVTIDWQATDDSGSATDPPNTVASIEGTYTYTSGPSCDPSNNCATGAIDLSIDNSNPTVICNAASFALNQPGAMVSASVQDTVSGPESPMVAALADTSVVGTSSVSLTGTDRAGRTTTVSCPYAVAYVFSGFFQPIDNLPIVNTANAGQVIPVKWRITDYNGVGVSAPASFVSLTSGSTSCSPSDPLDTIETYSGNSGLQYLGNGNWQFNWKTPKAYRGQCHAMRLNLADGNTGRIAEFQFR